MGEYITLFPVFSGFSSVYGRLLPLPLAPVFVVWNSLPIQTLAAGILLGFLSLTLFACWLGNTFLSFLTSQSLWTIHLINSRIECYSGASYASLSAPAQHSQTRSDRVHEGQLPNKISICFSVPVLLAQGSATQRFYLEGQKRASESKAQIAEGTKDYR